LIDRQRRLVKEHATMKAKRVRGGETGCIAELAGAPGFRKYRVCAPIEPAYGFCAQAQSDDLADIDRWAK